MTWVLDTSATGTAVGTGTSITKSYTMGSGTHPILIVVIALDNAGNPSVSSVTYNSIALTRAFRAANGGNKNAEIWYLVNPPATTANVVATFGDAYANIGIISYFGANQSKPVNTSGGDASASGATITKSLTTTAACLVVDICSKDNDFTIDASQTEKWDNTYSFNVMEGSIKVQTSPGDVTMQWTGGSGAFSHAVVAFLPDNPNQPFINKLRPRIYAPGNAR